MASKKEQSISKSLVHSALSVKEGGYSVSLPLVLVNKILKMNTDLAKMNYFS